MYDEELADYDEDEDPTQSVLDRRAERRKMKRFRLTHSQTRFLMSEFTRQAHPDAAHREKLSREIPGLSPRQVQVWFQNRRAKLKRLTSDDRERMLKSRTLPADFDMTPTLHPPFRGSLIVDTPLVSPTDYSPTYSAGSMSRPLVVDTMRRYSDSNRAPNSGFGQAPGYPMYTPPASGSPSSLLSPMAVPGDRQQHASYIPSPLSAGFRSSNPFGPPTTSADVKTGWTTHLRLYAPPFPGKATPLISQDTDLALTVVGQMIANSLLTDQAGTKPSLTLDMKETRRKVHSFTAIIQ
ncbi:MAG: hypothetical protein M1829_005880 [Trizodia sp. TS-e1964]|nr:MAG: hypothetical protein M1829_005880 [Trizodia sp. TS-e1964]